MSLQATRRVQQIINENAEDWIYDYVVLETKRMALAMFLPEKFIESIELRYHGNGRASVVNTFGTPDVPLAKFFNYGTKRNYTIEPKVVHGTPAPRSPRDKERVGDKSVKVVHPQALKWESGGETRFAKRVTHPGFPKTMAMEFGVQQGKKFLMQHLQKLIQDKL